MSADNVPLLSTQNFSAIQFDASKEFHRHTQQQELDSAFLGCERRPWIQAKPKPNTHQERDSLMTLLATSNQSYVTGNNVDKLVEQNIGFRDLASLTDTDLEMLGFASGKERNELMNMFSMMPNQNPSYDYICKSDAAQSYNNQIIGNAANHVMYLRSSLAATNYKLQLMPPEDVIVGDKRYASRFALEALNSVQAISEELAEDLRKLTQLAEDRNQKEHTGKERNLKLLYFTALVLGSACAWFWWWSKRSHSPSLDKMPLKI